MKFVSWNVNGIRAIYKKHFLDWFYKENADIVCLQETKADKSQFPKDITLIKDYNFYCSSSCKKGYSGVAVWSKLKPISVTHSIENEKFDTEGRVLKLVFEKFTLFNVYFPNGGASQERLIYKLEFYDYFLEYIKKLKNIDIIICGDYNTAHFPIDLARPKQNENNSGFLPIERKKLDALVNNNFIDTFRFFNKEPNNYTWWDYKTSSRNTNVGWRIDYFFISNNAVPFLKDANIQNQTFGSDHCPISINIY
jgi:exodeoxyribonuclease-3